MPRANQGRKSERAAPDTLAPLAELVSFWKPRKPRLFGWVGFLVSCFELLWVGWQCLVYFGLSGLSGCLCSWWWVVGREREKLCVFFRLIYKSFLDFMWQRLVMYLGLRITSCLLMSERFKDFSLFHPLDSNSRKHWHLCDSSRQMHSSLIRGIGWWRFCFFISLIAWIHSLWWILICKNLRRPCLGSWGCQVRWSFPVVRSSWLFVHTCLRKSRWGMCVRSMLVIGEVSRSGR